jgi:hypothetical protein
MGGEVKRWRWRKKWRWRRKKGGNSDNGMDCLYERIGWEVFCAKMREGKALFS